MLPFSCDGDFASTGNRIGRSVQKRRHRADPYGYWVFCVGRGMRATKPGHKGSRKGA